MKSRIRPLHPALIALTLLFWQPNAQVFALEHESRQWRDNGGYETVHVPEQINVVLESCGGFDWNTWADRFWGGPSEDFPTKKEWLDEYRGSYFGSHVDINLDGVKDYIILGQKPVTPCGNYLCSAYVVIDGENEQCILGTAVYAGLYISYLKEFVNGYPIIQTIYPWTNWKQHDRYVEWKYNGTKYELAKDEKWPRERAKQWIEIALELPTTPLP